MSRDIRLTQGFVAIVDDSDYEAVLIAGPWRASVVPGRRSVYAIRNLRRSESPREPHYMHQFLTGWAQTDHRNGDGLDNRRVNLRPATDTQNRANCGPYVNNTSGFKGVVPSRGNRWRAVIRVSGQQHHLGCYGDAEDAARAYDAAAREFFGEFARPNFPTEAST